MQVGDRVRLKTSLYHNGYNYDRGHEFNVVGNDSMRGIDVEDDEGRIISECRMIETLVFEVVPEYSIDCDSVEDFPI